MYEVSSSKCMLVVELKQTFARMRRKHGRYELYNLVEKCLLEERLTNDEKQMSDQLSLEKALLKEIRGLAMELSRNNPADWNKFLDVVIR